MSKTDQSIGQQQDILIWEGLQTLGILPEWMMAARDPERICSVFSQAIPELVARPVALGRDPPARRPFQQPRTKEEGLVDELDALAIRPGDQGRRRQ